ncbi:lamin tail domain-containing protein, partial [Corynebacterium afermentans]|uniref:lamin tail domain-containing protein n=1 Tax=Corynebacterium afermentans TaxID=38286 RepID=UPI002573BC3B
MNHSSRRALSTASAIALIVGTATVVSPASIAATDGSNLVIQELHAGGGQYRNGILSTFQNDYIILYNPTDDTISLDGWGLRNQLYSADVARGKNNQLTLTGEIGPKSNFIIRGGTYRSAQPPSKDLPSGEVDLADKRTDNDNEFNLQYNQGRVVLVKPSGNVVDAVTWGVANKNQESNKAAEGSAVAVDQSGDYTAKDLMPNQILRRKLLGVDTDDNYTDFDILTVSSDDAILPTRIRKTATSAKRNDQGEIVVTFADGTQANLGEDPATQNDEPHKIIGFELNEDNELVATYHDGTVHNIGKVAPIAEPGDPTTDNKGETGDKGPEGDKGETGDKGPEGDKGET